jgi:hypothetical protein
MMISRNVGLYISMQSFGLSEGRQLFIILDNTYFPEMMTILTAFKGRRKILEYTIRVNKAFSAIPCGIKNVKHDETVRIRLTLIFSNFSSNSNL